MYFCAKVRMLINILLIGKGNLMNFNYLIYKITRKSDGKHYVGVTRRALDVRVSFHWTEAKVKGVNPNGLAVALRTARQNGQKFEDCFNAKVLEEIFCNKNYALERERFYVENLGTMAPNGFNIQPGGSSAGAIENGIPIELSIDGKDLYFGAVSEAVSWINSNLKNEYLDERTVRRRLASDWMIDEAFGLAPHVDKRSQRKPFAFDGELYTSLRTVSELTGIPIDTLRSRLQRAKENNIDDYDLVERIPIRKYSSSCLPHPFNEEFDGIASRLFSELTGVSQTTVSSRARTYRTKVTDSEQTREGLLDYILNGVNRSESITLHLPSKRVISGSINKISKIISNDADLERYKVEKLSYSTIRKRLQIYCREHKIRRSEEMLKIVGLKAN